MATRPTVPLCESRMSPRLPIPFRIRARRPSRQRPSAFRRKRHPSRFWLWLASSQISVGRLRYRHESCQSWNPRLFQPRSSATRGGIVGAFMLVPETTTPRRWICIGVAGGRSDGQPRRDEPHRFGPGASRE